MRKKIDRNWSFRRTGEAESAWKVLNLPHDWAIEGEFSESEYIGSVLEEAHLEYRHDSYLPRGTGEYRKILDVPQLFDGQKLFLEFDGVFGESSLYVDGQFAGENHSGYTGKLYDISDFAAGKSQLSLQMPVSAERMQGWWYEGAGIYRHVWMMVKPACFLVPWGVAVNTPEVSADKAVLEIVAEVENAASQPLSPVLQAVIFSPDGSEIVRSEKVCSLSAGETVSGMICTLRREEIRAVLRKNRLTGRKLVPYSIGARTGRCLRTSISRWNTIGMCCADRPW